MIYRGDIVETGPAGAITSAPEHPYTRRLMLASPVADPAEQARRREERRRQVEADQAEGDDQPSSAGTTEARKPRNDPRMSTASRS
ncbi:hypothetical protein ACQP1W_31745 [Spirillospora sp. CA-255316]